MKQYFTDPEINRRQNLIENFDKDYDGLCSFIESQGNVPVDEIQVDRLAELCDERFEHLARVKEDKKRGSTKKGAKNLTKFKRVFNKSLKQIIRNLDIEFGQSVQTRDRRENESLAETIVDAYQKIEPVFEMQKISTKGEVKKYEGFLSTVRELDSSLDEAIDTYLDLGVGDSDRFLLFAGNLQETLFAQYELAVQDGSQIFNPDLVLNHTALLKYRQLKAEIDWLGDEKNLFSASCRQKELENYNLIAEEFVRQHSGLEVDHRNVDKLLNLQAPVLVGNELDRLSALHPYSGLAGQNFKASQQVGIETRSKVIHYAEEMAMDYSRKIQSGTKSELESLRKAVGSQERLFSYAGLDHTLLVEHANNRIRMYEEEARLEQEKSERDQQLLLESEKTERARVQTEARQKESTSKTVRARYRYEQAKENANAMDAEARREKAVEEQEKYRAGVWESKANIADSEARKAEYEAEKARARVDETLLVTIKDMKESFESQISKAREEIASQNNNISGLEAEIRQVHAHVKKHYSESEKQYSEINQHYSELNERIDMIEESQKKSSSPEFIYIERPVEREYKKSIKKKQDRPTPVFFIGDCYSYTDDLPPPKYSFVMNNVIGLLQGEDCRDFDDRFSKARMHVVTGGLSEGDYEARDKIKDSLKRDADNGMLREEILRGTVDETTVYRFIEALEEAA